jgi:hypothetical protein
MSSVRLLRLTRLAPQISPRVTEALVEVVREALIGIAVAEKLIQVTRLSHFCRVPCLVPG